MPLGGLHLAYRAPNPIHVCLTPVSAHNRERGVDLSGLPRGNGGFQLCHLQVCERFEFPEPLLLLRPAVEEISHRPEFAGQRIFRIRIGFEVGAVARQQVSALAGLGVLQR